MNAEFHRHYAVVFHFCITGQPVTADATGWAEPARQALLAAPGALQRYLAQRMLRELDEIGEGGSIGQGLGPFVLEADNAGAAELLRQTGTTDPQVHALIEFLEEDAGDAFLEFEPVDESFTVRITAAEVQEVAGADPDAETPPVSAPPPAQRSGARKAARRTHHKKVAR